MSMLQLLLVQLNQIGNSHLMVTKPKIDITKPKTFLIAKKLESMINALQHEQWRAPMTNKFITLIKNRT